MIHESLILNLFDMFPIGQALLQRAGEIYGPGTCGRHVLGGRERRQNR